MVCATFAYSNRCEWSRCADSETFAVVEQPWYINFDVLGNVDRAHLSALQLHSSTAPQLHISAAPRL